MRASAAAELLNPDLLPMPGASATALDSLRDDIRGRDAWAAVCRLATAQGRNEPRDAMACERARRLGADEESLTPPPPPPSPPKPRARSHGSAIRRTGLALPPGPAP